MTNEVRSVSTTPLTREQVRAVDRIAIEEYGQPCVVLMENAGRNAATLLMNLGATGPVSICCGKGNNAGDGFVIARHLENAGISVEVLLVTDPGKLAGDAAINYRILERAGTPIEVIDPAMSEQLLPDRLSNSEWIVDALLGTGAKGEINSPFLEAIQSINASGRKVFAVDLPSGLDCDTGKSLGACVRAHHTATFVAPKIGFKVQGASDFTGQVHVIDIGIPHTLLELLIASNQPTEV